MRFAEIRILLYEVEKQATCNSKIYMNKTNSVVLVSGTIILALGTGCHSKTSEKTTVEQQQKPNIIFILCDDMGVIWLVMDRNTLRRLIWTVWLQKVCFSRRPMPEVLSVPRRERR